MRPWISSLASLSFSFLHDLLWRINGYMSVQFLLTLFPDGDCRQIPSPLHTSVCPSVPWISHSPDCLRLKDKEERMKHSGWSMTSSTSQESGGSCTNCWGGGVIVLRQFILSVWEKPGNVSSREQLSPNLFLKDPEPFGRICVTQASSKSP